MTEPALVCADKSYCTRLEFPSPVVGPTGTGRSIAIFGGEPIIVWPEPTIIIILWGVICGDGVIWGVPQTLMVRDGDLAPIRLALEIAELTSGTHVCGTDSCPRVHCLSDDSRYSSFPQTCRWSFP